MSLRVLSISGGATLQDGGRAGYRHFGVPPGGAFDREALALANALLGNGQDAAGIEMAMAGGAFEVRAATSLSLCGAKMAAKLNGRALSLNGSFTCRPGDRLELGGFRTGARAYLCAPGGFVSELELGSTSGTSVATGAVLPIAAPALVPARALSEPQDAGDRPLRFFRTEDPDIPERFGEGVLLKVGMNSDRRGVRLAGLESLGLPEKPSEPSCVGTIQITPGGELVVLGPDGPTIGGYPKLGFLCLADVPRLARLQPGDEVGLEAVSPDDAKALTSQAQDRLERQCRLIRASL